MRITDETRLEDLPREELQKRTQLKLVGAYIETVRQLRGYSMRDLRGVFGEKSTVPVKAEAFLNRHGLALSATDQTDRGPAPSESGPSGYLSGVPTPRLQSTANMAGRVYRAVGHGMTERSRGRR